MGSNRGGGPRLLRALFVAGASMMGALLLASSGDMAEATPLTPAAVGTTTTTLPSLPKVSPTYTDGELPAVLLSHAIALSALGIDDTAVLGAVAATQNRMDSDGMTARHAQAEADAAANLADAARARESAARAESTKMAAAVRNAVLDLYMSGSAGVAVNPKAGALLIYAQDYLQSSLEPYGVLAQSRAVQMDRLQATQAADREARVASALAGKARGALADQHNQLEKLRAELASLSSASARAVLADHNVLTTEAAKELLSAGSLEFSSPSPLPKPVSTTSMALTWAFSELGKPYVWGATGPDSFDCSGLTQFVWRAAGVKIPRVAADQDAWTIPVPLSQLLPGDLVFFGTTDIHHVGIYIGDGLMINAPHTGTVVQVSAIWWSDLAGFGRVHYPGTPVPPHVPPSPLRPARPAVVPKVGPVPSQTKPPPGWKAKPGATTPIGVTTPSTLVAPLATDPSPAGAPVSTTTTPSTSTTTLTTTPGSYASTSTAPTDPSSTTTTTSGTPGI